MCEIKTDGKTALCHVGCAHNIKMIHEVSGILKCQIIS